MVLASRAFGDGADKVKEWLIREKLFTAHDFGVLAKDEGEVSTIVMTAAKAKGVPNEEFTDNVS